MWPVFVVNDDPASFTFLIAVDDALDLKAAMQVATVAHDALAHIRRGYFTSIARQRIHQAAFRKRVIDAYRTQCALCCLRHEELLDAAHILADSHPYGEPVVPIGVALCKLHHAAFDHFFLAIRPDCISEVRPDLLRETDGPMLKHGLQGVHGRQIRLPTRIDLRPSSVFLEQRHRPFLELAACQLHSLRPE